MVTIGRTPSASKAFFRSLPKHFTTAGWGHFWGPVLAMTVGRGSTIERLALDGRDEQGQRKNDKALRLPPISQLKARMRQAVWQEALEDVVKHTHERPVLRRLEELLAA